MNLLKVVENIANKNKCYNGLSGKIFTNTGFKAALIVSEGILDSTKVHGYRERTFEIAVSKGRVDVSKDSSHLHSNEENIVGYSTLLAEATRCVSSGKTRPIFITIEALEIQGHKRIYAQIISVTVL